MARKRRKKGRTLRTVLVFLVMIAGTLVALYFGDTQPIASVVGGDGKLPVSDVQDPFDAVFVDVGQGNCVIVLSRGKAALIDAGEEGNGPLVLDTLKAMGVDELDVVIGSHAHTDHVGALDEVIAGMEPQEIYMPAVGRDTAAFTDVENAAEKWGKQVEVPSLGQSIQLGDVTLEIYFSDEQEDLNESSLFVLVEGPGVTMLLTGDAGKASESQVLSMGVLPTVDVLQVGHHGSSTSTGRSLLQAITPQFGVIQVGKDNSYGHPAASTLKMLYSFHVVVLRQDECGNVYVDVDGQGHFSLSTEKEEAQPYATQKEAA